jgi:STE24 endopeptidase
MRPVHGLFLSLLALVLLTAFGVSQESQGVPSVRASEAGGVQIPDPSAEAMRYYRSANLLWLAKAGWSLVLPGLILFTGMSARLRTWAERVGGNWFFTVAIYSGAFIMLLYVLNFPLTFYEEVVRERAYGLSNQSFARWLAGSLAMLFVHLLSGLSLLWIPYLLIRKSPRRWWLYAGSLMLPYFAFVLFIGPIWIDPLFNDFSEIQDKALESRIHELADRAGVQGLQVYVADKSMDTRTLGAYVTGLSETKRIVFWDTILTKLNEDEILFVAGHELGHYMLGHVEQDIVLYAGFAIAVLYVVHRSAGAVLRRYKHAFGFEQLSDVASLPLLLLLINLFTLIGSPIALAYSRHVEREADRFGLEITKDNRAAATTYVKLQQIGLQNPRPGLLHKLWRLDHPPIGETIDFCNEYCPWKKGEPLRYGHLFRGD